MKEISIQIKSPILNTYVFEKLEDEIADLLRDMRLEGEVHSNITGNRLTVLKQDWR
ncbi:MAG: hypothetical protein IBX72_15170 [Nitrospirae bacterium]|nr:hypothetical protein [Nitrospirota bacterium]